MTVDDYLFSIEATLRTCCGFSRLELDELTWKEAEKFFIFYKAEKENELKRFSFRNLESTAIASHGKKSDFDKYRKELSIDSHEFVAPDKKADIDDQFDRVFK